MTQLRMKNNFFSSLLGTEEMPQRLSALIALAEDRGGVYVCVCGGGGRGLILKIRLEAANHLQAPSVHTVHKHTCRQEHHTHKNNKVKYFQGWGKRSVDIVGVLNTPNLS